MRPSRHISAIALTILFVAATCDAAVPEAPTAPAPQPASAAKVPKDLHPGLDDLMTMLVAPRHLKLYYAGISRNWELAAFEARELRSSLRRITGVIPRYQDQDLEETIAALIEPKLQATESAIAMGDVKLFGRTFRELTAACNGCHIYLEHPFLVVKVPDSPAQTAYPAQEFKPVP
jgi:hypothetical protein